MTCPLLSEPATELLCPDRSTATADTESFDDPQIGSTPSINGRETSLNQRVRKKVGAVVVVAVTAHARSTIAVPRGLERHSVLVPLPVVVHSLRSLNGSECIRGVARLSDIRLFDTSRSSQHTKLVDASSSGKVRRSGGLTVLT